MDCPLAAGKGELDVGALEHLGGATTVERAQSSAGQGPSPPAFALLLHIGATTYLPTYP